MKFVFLILKVLFRFSINLITLLLTPTISMNYSFSKWNRTLRRNMSSQHTVTHLFYKMTQIVMRNLHIMPCLHLILLLLVPLQLPVQTWQLHWFYYSWLFLNFETCFLLKILDLVVSLEMFLFSKAPPTTMLGWHSFNLFSWCSRFGILWMEHPFIQPPVPMKLKILGLTQITRHSMLFLFISKKTKPTTLHFLLFLIPLWQILPNFTLHLAPPASSIFSRKSWTGAWGGGDVSAEVAHIINLFGQLKGAGLTLPDNLHMCHVNLHWTRR